MLQKRAGFSAPHRVLYPKYDVNALAVDFNSLHERSDELAAAGPVRSLKAC
jgi:hypothetical protein